MKIRYFKHTLAFASLFALVASCAVDEGTNLADGIGEGAPNGVYMGNSNATGVIQVLASDTEGATFAVTPRLASPASEPIEVTVMLDATALKAYNATNGLKLVPIQPEDIELSVDGKTAQGEITATIPAGEIFSSVNVRLLSLNGAKYSYDNRYAIPVSIKSTKGSVKLLSSPQSTIATLNRKIKTSVIHVISSIDGGYTHQFTPKTPYTEEMSEWTMQYIAQFQNIHGNNQTTASLSGSNGFYNRMHKTNGLQVKSEGRDGLDTWTQKAISEGKWLHVSYVYRKRGLVGNLSVYVNGEMQKTFTTSLLYPNAAAGALIWGFGNGGVNDYYLREVRFWKRALSAAEIQDKYYLPENPASEGLEAYFPFTRESYDTATETFQDLTGKWTWSLVKHKTNANLKVRYEIVDNVVFPADQLTIESN